jgi:hypothetical protein
LLHREKNQKLTIAEYRLVLGSSRYAEDGLHVPRIGVFLIKQILAASKTIAISRGNDKDLVKGHLVYDTILPWPKSQYKKRGGDCTRQESLLILSGSLNDVFFCQNYHHLLLEHKIHSADLYK